MKLKILVLKKQAEWAALNQEIAEKYPELIQYISAEGDYVLDLVGAYDELAKKKKRGL